jgi:hypothetical protein
MKYLQSKTCPDGGDQERVQAEETKAPSKRGTSKAHQNEVAQEASKRGTLDKVRERGTLEERPNRRRGQKQQDGNKQTSVEIQKKRTKQLLAEDDSNLPCAGLQKMAPHAATGNPLCFGAPPDLLGFGHFKASNVGICGKVTVM